MPDPYRPDGEGDIDEARQIHDAFMRNRGQIQRMTEEASTFISDQWAPTLWAFYSKLLQQGFDPQQALQLVTVWFSATLAPSLKFPK